MALGWNSCQDIGLLDLMCNDGSTVNCMNICGGRPLAMKTLQVCISKNITCLKTGDTITMAVSCDLEEPLKDALYYDVEVDIEHGPKMGFSGEICNRWNGVASQLCNTNKIRWKSKLGGIMIEHRWKAYIGHMRARGQLSDENGLFLCVNATVRISP
jgi:hypothetical protein